MQRFVEVWSGDGILLYRSPTLQGGTLGGLPRPRAEGTAEPSPSTVRLADGTRVRMAISVHTVDRRQVFLRVAHSEQVLWREIVELVSVLILLLRHTLVLAGCSGVHLACKALAIFAV